MITQGSHTPACATLSLQGGIKEMCGCGAGASFNVTGVVDEMYPFPSTYPPLCALPRQSIGGGQIPGVDKKAHNGCAVFRPPPDYVPDNNLCWTKKGTTPAPALWLRSPWLAEVTPDLPQSGYRRSHRDRSATCISHIFIIAWLQREQI